MFARVKRVAAPVMALGALVACSEPADPAGTFLFVANQGSGTVSGFRLDPTTGKPVPLPGPVHSVPSPTFVGAWRVP